MVKSVVIPATTGIAGLFIGLTVARGFAQPTQQTQRVNDFPDLGKGLRATPGCLGVSSASVDGKLCIFAWFKNKAAVNAWYHSKMHVDAMRRFFPDFSVKQEALPMFKDSKAPILMVASVTPSDKPGLPGSNLAVSQIAIEAYTPVPGGVALGKTFAPEGLQVPGMTRIPALGQIP